MNMAQKSWTAVDDYLCHQLLPHDPVLEATLASNRQAGLADIDVAPNQGAYSTIWMAAATDDNGHITTLEIDEKHAAVARSNIQRAGFEHKVQVRLGPAAETLSKLHKENAGPYDFIFIDADKPNNPVYLEWSLKLARVGTVIFVDNVVRGGGIIDADSEDAKIQGTRSMLDMMKDSQYLDMTALQTVGSKGWDGFVIGRVIRPKV